MNAPVDRNPDAPEAEFEDGLASLVKEELEPGERLLWAGRPLARRNRLPRSAVVGWLIVVFASAVSFGLIKMVRMGANPAEGFGVLVVVAVAIALGGCIGLAAGVNQRRVARSKRENTLYALTDRRAIIWAPAIAKGSVAVHTIPRGQVSRVHRIEFDDGTGDVVLTYESGANWNWTVPTSFESGVNWNWTIPTSFEGIANVRRVEEQVRRTLVVPKDANE